MNPKGAYQASYQQRIKEKKILEKQVKDKEEKGKRLLKAKIDYKSPMHI